VDFSIGGIAPLSGQASGPANRRAPEG